MLQQSYNSHLNNQSSPSGVINYTKLVLLVISNWYLFIIALLITSSGAYFYIKYTIPSYQVSSVILIEDGDNASLPGIDNNLLEGFGLRPESQNIDNQIVILTSWSLIDKALDELPFNIDIYKKSFLKNVSYYPLNPFILIPGPNGVPTETEFLFRYYHDNVFQLVSSSKSEIVCDTFVTFGQEIKLCDGSFTILPYPGMDPVLMNDEKIFFTFYDKETVLEEYRERLTIVASSNDATTLNLVLRGPNKSKDIVFIDKLVEVFMNRNLEKKNHEANRIIEFIDAQLIDVSDSLMITETELQEFRSRNRIMDVSAQAQQIIDRAVVYENEKARLNLEASYYEYLDDYLSEDSSKEVPISPATMGIEDPLLARLMQELAGLQAEYFSSGVGERNPIQTQLEIRISNTKQSLKETLQGIMLANNMALKENSQQIENLNSEASGLPIKERQLLGFERKFNLNNVLYTFLLQKRAEAQIQKASNRPDNELIDPARASMEPVAPNVKIVYLLAIVLGLVFPFSIILINNAFHNKISSEEDLRLLSDLPIVGHIPHSRLSYNSIVLSEPQSILAESFRSLRTRMEFLTKKVKSPIILITSSMPGEGKTFSALNLASAYSIAGKKTVLVGFDLRRPTLSKCFGIKSESGLSTYLIGKDSLEDIIMDTGFDNLSLIPSGPIPPNPGEISSSDSARELLDLLRGRFDFIIVDSAPIGVVSDNYSIATIADATILMVRHGQTSKRSFEATLMEARDNGVKGLGILINDIRSKKISQRYTYNYKPQYKLKYEE